MKLTVERPDKAIEKHPLSLTDLSDKSEIYSANLVVRSSMQLYIRKSPLPSFESVILHNFV